MQTFKMLEKYISFFVKGCPEDDWKYMEVYVYYWFSWTLSYIPTTY